ncbi:MAG: hypothetical protein L6V93_08385 [Clostridiales bacterium]|nr:MAG: hypothetical protein L6V93_08385 [Clostridiales bacterium]
MTIQTRHFYAKGGKFAVNSVYEKNITKNLPVHTTSMFTTVIRSRFHYNFADFLFIGTMLLLCIIFVKWSFAVSEKVRKPHYGAV